MKNIGIIDVRISGGMISFTAVINGLEIDFTVPHYKIESFFKFQGDLEATAINKIKEAFNSAVDSPRAE